MFGLAPDFDVPLTLGYLGMMAPVLIYCLVSIIRGVTK